MYAITRHINSFNLSRLGVLGIFLISISLTGCDTTTACPECRVTTPGPVAQVVGVDDQISLSADEVSKVANLIANDTNAVSIANFTQPSNGHVEPLGATGVTYFSDGFVGSTSFTYVPQGSNGDLGQATTVNVTVQADTVDTNTRPVITLNFSGALQLPSSLSTLATCNDAEDGSLPVRFTRPNGSAISQSEILSLNEQTDITVNCGPDSNGASATPVVFGVNPEDDQQQNNRPVITLAFSGALELPYSGPTPLATCSDQEDGNLSVRYTRPNGSAISPQAILALTTNEDITVNCTDSEGLRATPVTFSVVPAAFSGPVLNEDIGPMLDAGDQGLVEVLDDDYNSPSDQASNLLEIIETDMERNVNCEQGNLHQQSDGTFLFQVSATGRLVQLNVQSDQRYECRYTARRTTDGATATAFIREAITFGAPRHSLGIIRYNHTDGRSYNLRSLGNGRYQPVK